MGVRLKKIYDLNSDIIKSFERVSGDLVLCNIKVKTEEFNLDSRPLHWRYDFGDFPPLDISFDSESYLLKEITIFVEKKNIDNKSYFEEPRIVSNMGFPVFDFGMLKKHEYYYDEICEIKILLFDLKLTVYILNKKVEKNVMLNKDLGLLLDADSEFVGFVVYNLSVEDLEFLE